MILEGKKSKRGRVREGRPTKRTPEAVAKIAESVASGLTDEEASLLAGVNPDTMTEWRKDPEFSGAIKRATAQRLKLRLERIEAGEAGWQGTAWALERIYPKRFSRPDVQFAQQINVSTDSGKRGIVMSAETCKALSDAYDRRMAEKRAANGASGRTRRNRKRQQGTTSIVFFAASLRFGPQVFPFRQSPSRSLLPFLQTDEKLLVKYLPDFMRFRAFSGASVRNGL